MEVAVREGALELTLYDDIAKLVQGRIEQADIAAKIDQVDTSAQSVVDLLNLLRKTSGCFSDLRVTVCSQRLT